MKQKHKEINALVEHVQLNKAGWLLDGLKGIIKQIYGERNNPILSIVEIIDKRWSGKTGQGDK